jgi:hypothetical protein
MNERRHAAPRKAWLIAIVIVVPMLLPVFAPISFVEPAGLRGANEYHYRYDLSEFLIEDRAERSRPVGVMLAMSGGNCATVGPIQLTADGVHLYVAFYLDATAGTFDGLMDLLVEGRPDFLIVQDTVLVLDRPLRRYEQLSNKYEEARSYWSGQLLGLAQKLGVGFANFEANEESWRCPAISKQKMMWEDAVQATIRRIDSYSQQRRTVSVDLLDTFSAANIPVLIASPPANSYTFGYGLAVHEAAGEFIDEGSVNGTVSLHRQASLTPTAQFNDPMHLSPNASQAYREWLNNEIVQVLEGQVDD